ncbi:MAG: hypothetical protein F6K04_18040 [Leptolyngbya sp. SIO4C5]|nr:hypothetical protein [Leptolyngbya sp. SIO4C5]
MEVRATQASGILAAMLVVMGAELPVAAKPSQPAILIAQNQSGSTTITGQSDAISDTRQSEDNIPTLTPPECPVSLPPFLSPPPHSEPVPPHPFFQEQGNLDADSTQLAYADIQNIPVRHDQLQLYIQRLFDSAEIGGGHIALHLYEGTAQESITFTIYSDGNSEPLIILISPAGEAGLFHSKNAL